MALTYRRDQTGCLSKLAIKLEWTEGSCDFRGKPEKTTIDTTLPPRKQVSTVLDAVKRKPSG
jgi:hypothetical protein